MSQGSLPAEWIIATQEDHVLQLQLNRPQKKNALTQNMYQFLADQLSTANDNSDIHVVLLCGHPQVFCAGNDIQDFLQQSLAPVNEPANPEQPAAPVLQFLRQLTHFSKPLVVAANGPCVGIGTTLMMHCDLVCLGEQAKLQTPFVDLGLCPEAAASVLMPQGLGHHRASELLLLGEVIDAPTALQWGLANRVFSAELLLPETQALAKRLAAKPQQALRLSRRLLKEQHAAVVSDRLEQESQHFLQGLTTQEAQQAFRAFLQK
jgi:enoyl-CoA hydratase/carnithine racemase